MTKELGHKISWWATTCFVTNTERLQEGIDKGVANSI